MRHDPQDTYVSGMPLTLVRWQGRGGLDELFGGGALVEELNMLLPRCRLASVRPRSAVKCEMVTVCLSDCCFIDFIYDIQLLAEEGESACANWCGSASRAVFQKLTSEVQVQQCQIPYISAI